MALSKITTNSLASNAVTSAAIANGEIALVDLANDSVGSDQLASGSVTSAKLASTVSISELSTTRSNTIAVNANNFNLGVVSGNVTINVAQSTFFTANTSNNTTWAFEGEPDSSKATGFILELTSGGDYTQTWPAAVKWPSATPPTLSTGATAVDVLVFITNDGGTSWRGAISQTNSS